MYSSTSDRCGRLLRSQNFLQKTIEVSRFLIFTKPEMMLQIFFVVMKAFAILLAFVISTMKGNLLKGESKINDPPCFFNPLCTCSKAFPDLGRVTCAGFPLLTIPQQINTSKVFMLHLESNGLFYIEPYFFRQTGLARIEISQNCLTQIKKETFSGLELSLSELILKNNKFRKVPNQSFHSLQRLKLLDLSGNKITNIEADDWLGLKNSLRTLILRDNKLTTLGPRIFSTLQQLQSLDLSGNSLFEFDVSAFKEGPLMLTELYLSHNLFSSIPSQELSELRKLRHLDLSFNQITEIEEFSHDRSKTLINLFLDTLRLDYNQIQYLPAEAFKGFPRLNSSYLNGNPIRYIEKNAFKSSKIRELYFKDCEISELAAEALTGIQNYLEIIDLEGNNITTLPLNIFKGFNSLKSLTLKNNFFKRIDFEKIFGEDRPSFEHLDIIDLQYAAFDFESLKKLPNLRSLALSSISQPSITANDLPNFMRKLDVLKISHSNIKSIKSHAFKNVRGIRRLEVTDNSISIIEDKAFAEIGHSLIHLSLANGFSSSLIQLPSPIFKELIAIEHLDLSDNNIKVLSSDLFLSMKQLKRILIQDNFIEFLPRGMFQGEIHSQLTSIQLSFNQLSSIESESFIDLNKLEYLWLNDNRIRIIERRAFANLPNLKFLFLQGNKLIALKEESFEDLPQLEKLDISYNKIKILSFGFLDQVGTFSAFTLNLSYNALYQLTINKSRSDNFDFAELHVNIKALDLSHNNISFIGSGFFKPIQPSITHLYLCHNKLPNVTRNVFENLMHLQWLDISYNKLHLLEHDAFTNTQNIQVLYFSNNRLQEIPKNFLKGLHRLRIFDLSSNNLRTLPHNLFSDGKIERLYMSKNHLEGVPISSFDKSSAQFLSELDLSENAIVSLPSSETFAAFKNLYRLDLSKNRLIQIEDGTFSYLRHLHSMDLSHNSDLGLTLKGPNFYGLEKDVLEILILKNISLNAIPVLHFTSLKSLDVSENNISTIPFEFFHNLSELERIEFSNNAFVAIPPGVSALTKLQYLGLSGNPLKLISFQQSFTLRELDLRNTSIIAIEKGALGKLPLLEKLKLTINGNLQNLNLSNLLKANHGLTSLLVEILENEKFMENKFRGSFPVKLKNLSLFGRGLKQLPNNLLQGIQSPQLNLIIFNTSIQEISEEVFHNGKKVRNLTLDIRSNKLKTISNPNTGYYPNIAKKTFLLQLKIADNDWNCDCSVGWIEGWQRKKRHYFGEGNSEDCFLSVDDLREVVCSNRKPYTFIEIFKQDLECGWNNSRKIKASLRLVFFLSASTLLGLFLKNIY